MAASKAHNINYVVLSGIHSLQMQADMIEEIKDFVLYEKSAQQSYTLCQIFFLLKRGCICTAMKLLYKFASEL